MMDMTEDEIMALNEALASDNSYTVEYLDTLSESVRAEVIDGRLFYMAAPTLVHQELIGFLYMEIGSYVREKSGECKVLLSPFGVRLNLDEKTKVEPDLLVVCNKEILTEKECNGAPDFVAEILSPSSKNKDCTLKLGKYQDAGVREYWILDWERGLILVYRFDQLIVEFHSFQDCVKLSIFEDLEIDFGAFKI